MAGNAELIMKVFDSGIDFSNIIDQSTGNGYAFASNLIADKFDKIKASAALGDKTLMALAFGTDNYYSGVDQNTKKYYFGYEKNTVEAGDPNVQNSSTAQNPLKNIALIGFLQDDEFAQDTQNNQFNINAFSTVIIPHSFDVDSVYTYTATEKPYAPTIDIDMCLTEIFDELINGENTTGSQYDVDRNIVGTLTRTATQSQITYTSSDLGIGPAFIPVNIQHDQSNTVLDWINTNSADFFAKLSTVAGNMSIKTTDLKLYVILASVYEAGASTLPMSTINSLYVSLK